LKPVLVIDSGPLIATLFEKDRYHLQAVKGFQQLQQEEQTLILPLPIIFEVHRWLLQQQSSQLAQAVFTAIDCAPRSEQGSIVVFKSMLSVKVTSQRLNKLFSIFPIGREL